MKLRRIGDKVISEEKLHAAIDAILTDRENGATQGETAEAFHVQRSFVSFLETLGEVRRGSRVALIAFPVSNAESIIELGKRYNLDLVLALSQHQRETIEMASGVSVFNTVIDTIEELIDYDVVIICASDARIASFERILAVNVVGHILGESPLRHDVEVDIDDLEQLVSAVVIQESKDTVSAEKPKRVVGPVQRRAGELVERWRK